MQSGLNPDNQRVATASCDVDDAVGVSGDCHWYVAIVNSNTELASAEKIRRLGFDAFVASQKEHRIWRNGRKAIVDRIIIRSMVFIRCSERQRLKIVTEPYIFRFLTDRAARPTEYGRRVAIIPDEQIQILRFMLGQSDIPVGFTQSAIGAGDTVRVLRGALRGLEGRVTDVGDGKSLLTVQIDFLGGATVQLPSADLRKK